MQNLQQNPVQDRSDLVAYWSVPLFDGVHIVEFEHGTTTGKRVLRLDGKEVFRKEWMFKLVGDIKFTLGQENVKCELRVDPIPPFSFSYSLWVDGKPIEKFAEKQQESMKSWSVVNNSKRFAVVFAKQTLEIWVNGQAMDVEREFVEDGIEMKFMIDRADAMIRSTAKQGKKEIVYKLYVDNRLVLDDSNNNT
ncbi:fas apoptotic inhibitory molecule 1 [Euwallacea fornicatus]|uniref:fas apoptotic inhibitory molecule 1 n=1 Tax=Euwallacea fornicatus TaxID=995702 RepID=UPI00338EC19B